MCCLSNPPFWLVVVVFASIKIQKLLSKKEKDSLIPSGSFALTLNQVAYLIQILTFPLSNSIFFFFLGSTKCLVPGQRMLLKKLPLKVD